MEFNLDSWDKTQYDSLYGYLVNNADANYQTFHSSLVPGETNVIIGVRMPVLRKIGKEISKGNWRSYLSIAIGNTHEEIMLRGIVIGLAKTEYDELIDLTDNYLPLISNWALCDSFCGGLKSVRKFEQLFFHYINTYLKSDNPWVIRTGLVIMLSHYLKEEYLEDILNRCDQIHHTEYYVKMAQAWLISICYIKYPDITEDYLKRSSLDDWTFNKAIQKTRESLRITQKQKDFLNTLKH